MIRSTIHIDSTKTFNESSSPFISLTAIAIAAVFFSCSAAGKSGPPSLPAPVSVPQKVAGGGRPYHGHAQAIPGKLVAAYYDEGGEGVAYHDTDPENQASICCGGQFRTDEGVDIGVVKDHDQTMGPTLEPGAIYLGWVREGEWVNYTVDVNEAATYVVDARMSSKTDDCAIQLLVDGQDKLGPIVVKPATGSVHRWNDYPALLRVSLPAGRHLLTLKFVKGQKGTQNFETLAFRKVL